MGVQPTVRPEVVRLFNDGVSYDKIAKQLGISLGNVRQQVHVARIKGEISEDHDRLAWRWGAKREEVYRLLVEGKSAQEIADEMGISKQSVHHHITSMRANPRGRDPRVLAHREPKCLPYYAERLARERGIVLGPRDDFHYGLGNYRIVQRLVDETPDGMTVMEYAAKLIVDVFAEDEE
jgi:DNA-binding CsgD family transcriptional regulator